MMKRFRSVCLTQHRVGSASLGYQQFLPNRLFQNRNWSHGAPTERLRIAIVGGGAAGLSAALHLAPLASKGLIEPIDVYDNHSPDDPKREIGVGIWSTGLDPFRPEMIDSHQALWSGLTTAGSWVGDVGYRTPSGQWLAQSHLPTDQDDSTSQNSLPRLLFLRECDFLQTLQQATTMEENLGTVRLHQQGCQTRVTGIHEDTLEWSAQLVLGTGTEGGSVTDRNYHLILAADGMNSTLRMKYGGYASKEHFIVGTAVLDGGSARDLTRSSSSRRTNDSWEDLGQTEATSVQDRKYTVFRGNANLTNAETGVNGISFQTWGHGKSMRYATVPMAYPGASGKIEKQVWFVTINDDSITNEPSPTKRREMLLDTFSTWHDPICRTIEATPPDTILMERALAHKHTMGPVLNVNHALRQIHRGQLTTSHSGPGPVIAFLGDAFMTVDPILAQGFTMAMEGAAALPRAIEQSCVSFDTYKCFDPFLLRKELQDRHNQRTGRLVKLLRATELVQALGQPTSGTLFGFASRHIVRPLMQISPNFVKTPVFNAMLRYSLGR